MPEESRLFGWSINSPFEDELLAANQNSGGQSTKQVLRLMAKVDTLTLAEDVFS